MTEKKESEESLGHLWRELSKNRFGLIGFGLSLLQLVVHGAWLTMVAVLSSEPVRTDSWQMWSIAILMILGGLLTMISLFVCLYGVIHGKPKVLAILGMMLSFFVGTTTTFVLLLNALD